MGLFDNTFDALSKAMDLNFKRHTVLTGNIANTDTPNYRARDIDFSGELVRAIQGTTGDLSKTDPLHMDIGGEMPAHIVYDNSSAMGSDGNNVDLDVTVGKLSEASRAYSNASNLLGIKFRLLRQIINGRGA